MGDCDIVRSNGFFDDFSAANFPDWPSDSSHEFVDVMQDITHDKTHWFMTSTAYNGSLARYGKTANLSSAPSSVVQNLFSPGWKHFGDLDYSNGWLYVALERDGHGEGNATRNAIGAIPVATYNQKSTYKTFQITEGPQMTGGSFPWVARDPGTDYFYSSTFNSTNKLQRYKATFNVGGMPVSFQRCGEVTISENIDRVQGGAFSESGKLYIATDPKTAANIIKVVDLSGHLAGKEPLSCATPPVTTAPVIKGLSLDKDYGNFFGAPYEEVEGVTIWNLDNGGGYDGKSLGQIHTILINKEFGSDDGWWLKHHRVTPLQNL